MQIGYLSANPFASDAEQFTITPEQQAAQRLHDAAPELLAALKECIKHLPKSVHVLADMNLSDEVRDSPEFAAFYMARAAIAKAEG